MDLPCEACAGGHDDSLPVSLWGVPQEIELVQGTGGVRDVRGIGHMGEPRSQTATHGTSSLPRRIGNAAFLRSFGAPDPEERGTVQKR